MTEDAKPRRKARAKTDYLYTIDPIGGNPQGPRGFYWGTIPVDAHETHPDYRGPVFAALTIPAGPYGPPPRCGYLDPTYGTGFPLDYKPERLTIDRRIGEAPYDIAPFLRETLLLSDRAKQLFEEADAAAFQFVRLEAFERDARGDHPVAPYWLCDVVRCIDAVVRDQPGVKFESLEGGGDCIDVPSTGKVLFDASRIGAARVFRIAYNTMYVMVDGGVRSMITKARLVGHIFGLKGWKQ